MKDIRDNYWLSLMSVTWHVTAGSTADNTHWGTEDNYKYISLGLISHALSHRCKVVCRKKNPEFHGGFAIVVVHPIQLFRDAKKSKLDPSRTVLTSNGVFFFKMVMARQTLLQVTTRELTFFPLLNLSGPQTILTVFGHSISLCNGSMK